MTGAIVGITVAYIALAVLLLNLGFYSRWPVWVKGGAILITTILYFVTFSSLQRFGGWPTGSDMPREFVVLSTYVEEPDEALNTEGGIYLWVLARGEEQVDTIPRAYRLPYSRELHEQASRAAKQISRDVVQMGKIETVPVRSGAAAQAALIEERVQRIIIRDLPSPELPDK